MRFQGLNQAILNAKRIYEQIKVKYPSIRAYLVLSTRQGQAPLDASLEFLLDEADHFFVENDAVSKAWCLLDQIFDENEKLKENRRIWPASFVRETESKIESLQRSYRELIPSIEIDDEVEISLRWDDIDFEINRQLGVDADLVDVSRSNTKIGGIKICLGTIKNLSNKII